MPAPEIKTCSLCLARCMPRVARAPRWSAYVENVGRRHQSHLTSLSQISSSSDSCSDNISYHRTSSISHRPLARRFPKIKSLSLEREEASTAHAEEIANRGSSISHRPLITVKRKTDSSCASQYAFLSADPALSAVHRSRTPPWRPKHALRTAKWLKKPPKAPSTRLTAALQLLGCEAALPKDYPTKLDLSYASPRMLNHPLPAPGLTKPSTSPSLDRIVADSQARSLPEILSSYLISLPQARQHAKYTSTRGEDDTGLLRVFSENNLALLRSKGYDVIDVLTWCWILTAGDSCTASLRLTLTEHNPLHPLQSRCVPIFVLLYLLRRHHLSAPSLKLLINYTWAKLRGTTPSRTVPDTKTLTKPPTWSFQRWQSPDSLASTAPSINETTVMTLTVRLLRHARQVWPEAVVNVAEMFSCHISGTSPGSSRKGLLLEPEKANRLTFLYNRVLSLLAVPSSIQPFLSVPHHQRAQFNLVRRMNDYSPTLPITQEGYRAITRVQLAHRKTVTERRWEEKKARSWPPWKQENLGIDAEIKDVDGVTRATEAMARMREAGYAGGHWEKVADIFSGWDTDKSPTIQTRVFAERVPGIVPRHENIERKAKSPQSEDDTSDVWAARIRATRTVREAWACFLIREDRRLSPSPTIYHAMFEKLVAESKRVGQVRREQVISNETDEPVGSLEQKKSLPGDGKEVGPSPLSPNEAVYIRSDPPNLMDFFNRMVREGLRPSERSLAFLVSHAESVEAGAYFIQKSQTMTPQALSALIAVNGSGKEDEATAQELRCLPILIFSAFVRLLCRSASRGAKVADTSVEFTASSTRDTKPTHTAIDQKPAIGNAILHAFRLMHLRRPCYRPPWNALLSALASPRAVVSGKAARETSLQDILSWTLMQEIVRQMRHTGLCIDVQTFQVLCIGMEKAAIASLRAEVEEVKPRKESSDRLEYRLEATKMRVAGTGYIKGAFQELVGNGHTAPNGGNLLQPVLGRTISSSLDPSQLLPKLLAVPGPAQLHAYIRLLGIFRDFQSLEEVVSWMVRLQPEIDAVVQESSNGRNLLRRALTAVRVFLERSWEGTRDDDEMPDQSASTRADDETIMRVKEAVEGVESWGGWPDDETVQIYCRRGRFY